MSDAPAAGSARRSGVARRTLRRGGAVVGWSGVVVGVVGVVARTIAIPWQAAVIAAAASPYLAAAALVGGVLLSIRRSRTGTSLATAVVIWTVAVQAPLFVATPPRTGGGLVVLQANLGVGGADATDLVETVRTHRVDVLTTNELTADALARLGDAGLDETLPHRFVIPFPGGAGTGIWSRYPLDQTVAHDEFSFQVLTARLFPSPGAPVHVVAAHLLPPWPYPSSTWLAELGRLEDVLQEVGPASETVLASGDLNAGMDNPQLRAILRGGFRDAAEQAGTGFSPTYPTDRFTPPLLVLDHLLVRHADPAAVTTIPLPGSDHRGLVVELTLPPA